MAMDNPDILINNLVRLSYYYTPVPMKAADFDWPDTNVSLVFAGAVVAAPPPGYKTSFHLCAELMAASAQWQCPIDQYIISGLQ